MPESAIETSGGPSLEQILWRAMDRWEERPALVDSDEFAAHIEGVFHGDVPAETWVARFFDGADGLHKGPSDMAEAIVRATRDRLAVYEFDLRKLEYVIVESEEKVVVVSDFGQFALRNDDMVSRAIEAAVIPAGQPGSSASRGSAGALQRGGSEPKAYFVRSSGEVVAVDVKKVARSLEQLLVRQVSMPAVSKPAARLLPFAPSRRSLTEAREVQALRQDTRTRQAIPAPPRLERTRAADARAAAPAGAQTALFLLMPDGTLARPEMGSATRWQEMVGQYARNTAATVPVTQGQRLTVQAGNVVAIIQHVGSPGTVGERTLARSEALSAVRGDSAPIRTLGNEDLAKALAAGAMVVPGLARADQFWIQPEAAFRPDEKSLAQGGTGAARSPAVVAQPVQLGQISGDPWADWALTGGGELSPEVMMALRGRSKHALRSTLGDSGGELSIAPELADRLRGVRGQELRLAGAPVVGFRAPDGSVVMQRGASSIRLAALDRPDAVLEPLDLQLPGTGAPLAARSGAIPATALAALQMALEQTANAGGYKLPMLRLVSAPDAQDVGAAMDLSSIDPRRTSVRLAGPSSVYDGGSGQVAQLMLSMPFPNGSELHVGDDLSEALQAYLGNAVQPAMVGAGGSLFAPMAVGGGAGAGSMMLRLRGGEASQQLVSSDTGDLLDWGGMHGQAAQRAQDAVITLDLPMVQPLVAGSSSVSGLPILLQRALAQAGDWTPGPGAAMPVSIREFAVRGPFNELGGAQPEFISMAPQARPLNPGEEEIVIPMPLWTQMGRGQLSETDQIMASPLARAGYSPPMGVYRLVVPGGGPVDMTGGAPPGTPGIVDLTGPTGLELVARPNRSGVQASSLGGRQFLGRVAVDDGESVVTRRGRIRVGAPLAGGPAQGSFSGGADSASAQQGGFQPGDSVLSQGGDAPDAAPAVVSGAQPSLPAVPDAPSGTYIDGTYGGASAASASSGGAPMAGALSSAMQMSSDVAARTSVPGRPSIGSGSTSSPAFGSDSSGFTARAQAAGQQSAGSASLPTSGAGSAGGSASSASSGVSGAGTLPSAGGSDQTLVATAAEGSVVGAQVGSGVADMTGASASASHAASAVSHGSGKGPSFITGLQPGMWSGNRRSSSSNYQSWSYASGRDDVQRSAGGVDLGSLSRPLYPSLPTSLRFRYVGAPLWWSGSTRAGAPGSRGDDFEESDTSPAGRAMRSGLRAATSAASIWRSILVSSPQWGGPAEDFSGGMDSGQDKSADEMSSLSRRFDALTSASLVGSGGAAGAGAGGAAYVAVNGSGAAGTVSKAAAQRARLDSIEMSIVAAIPPAPPPLESMGSGATGGDAPHARAKGHGHGGGHGQHKEGEGAVSHSKIEGSVDAIAQRIYHRIRRRIQSDRERFGG